MVELGYALEYFKMFKKLKAKYKNLLFTYTLYMCEKNIVLTQKF